MRGCRSPSAVTGASTVTVPRTASLQNCHRSQHCYGFQHSPIHPDCHTLRLCLVSCIATVHSTLMASCTDTASNTATFTRADTVHSTDMAFRSASSAAASWMTGGCGNAGDHDRAGGWSSGGGCDSAEESAGDPGSAVVCGSAGGVVPLEALAVLRSLAVLMPWKSCRPWLRWSSYQNSRHCCRKWQR